MTLILDKQAKVMELKSDGCRNLDPIPTCGLNPFEGEQMTRPQMLRSPSPNTFRPAPNVFVFVCLFVCLFFFSLWLQALVFVMLPVGRIDILLSRNISRQRVFHKDIQTTWFWKNEGQPSFRNRLRGVWIPDETLFRVFDMTSKTIHSSWRISKQKFAKIYAN